MKSTSFFKLTIFLMVIGLSISSCKKENAGSDSGNNDTPAAINNKPPFADAGKDTTIMLPVDSINLNGTSSYDTDGKIVKYSWRQLCHNNALIIDGQSAKTTAKNLLPGLYQFELTVTDDRGLSSRDTLKVGVLPSATTTGPNGLDNLTWIFPWYAALEINNIYSYVPHGRPFKIFIQRDSNPAWIEVPPLSANSTNTTYEYFIETRLDGAGMYSFGSLYIFYYGTETNDTPNVKIEF